MIDANQWLTFNEEGREEVKGDLKGELLDGVDIPSSTQSVEKKTDTDLVSGSGQTVSVFEN